MAEDSREDKDEMKDKTKKLKSAIGLTVRKLNDMGFEVALVLRKGDVQLELDAKKLVAVVDDDEELRKVTRDLFIRAEEEISNGEGEDGAPVVALLAPAEPTKH